MESYGGFASVYDLFMDETPYEKWATFLTESLKWLVKIFIILQMNSLHSIHGNNLKKISSCMKM